MEAKPIPVFTWRTPAGVTEFNVQNTVMDPLNNLIYISRLEFTRTALSMDAGQYSCTGLNVAGNFSQSVALTVLGETISSCIVIAIVDVFDACIVYYLTMRNGRKRGLF